MMMKKNLIGNSRNQINLLNVIVNGIIKNDVEIALKKLGVKFESENVPDYEENGNLSISHLENETMKYKLIRYNKLHELKGVNIQNGCQKEK